jgi:hypothetical protein
MTDPEVARQRRLRNVALRVREIARRLGAARWGIDEPLLARGACASWRIARVVTGKLMEQPHLRYQRSAGLGALIDNRLAAEWIASINKNRSSGLKAYASELQSLARQLDDVRSLTWSTEFSDALGRSQGEIKSLLRTLAVEIHGAQAESLPLATCEPVRAAGSASIPRNDRLAGEIGKRFEPDWPYLAF